MLYGAQFGCDICPLYVIFLVYYYEVLIDMMLFPTEELMHHVSDSVTYLRTPDVIIGPSGRCLRYDILLSFLSVVLAVYFMANRSIWISSSWREKRVGVRAGS